MELNHCPYIGLLKLKHILCVSNSWYILSTFSRTQVWLTGWLRAGRFTQDHLIEMRASHVNQIFHVTLFHNHSSSFAIFRDIYSDRFSRSFTKVCGFKRELTDKFSSPAMTMGKLHCELLWNPLNFRESSWTMVVIICQFPSFFTKIRESPCFNSLGMRAHKCARG